MGLTDEEVNELYEIYFPRHDAENVPTGALALVFREIAINKLKTGCASTVDTLTSLDWNLMMARNASICYHRVLSTILKDFVLVIGIESLALQISDVRL